MEASKNNKQILWTNLSHKINIKFEFPEEGINEPKIISDDENDLLETILDKLLYQLKLTNFSNNSKHFFLKIIIKEKKNSKTEKYLNYT